MEEFLLSKTFEGNQVSAGKDLNLKQCFGMAYLSLLDAVAQNDSMMLGRMCEKNLFRAFNSSLQDIHYEYAGFQILNFNPDTDDAELVAKKMRISVVDTFHTIGADMDREANRINGL